CLSIHRPARLRALPSFPTRRSSDLTAGFRRILVTESDHPYVEAWWPPGHGLGYEHGFVHQAVDLVRAIGAGEDPSPSFEDGLHRSEEHTSELQSRFDLVCRLLLEKK